MTPLGSGVRTTTPVASSSPLLPIVMRRSNCPRARKGGQGTSDGAEAGVQVATVVTVRSTPGRTLDVTLAVRVIDTLFCSACMVAVLVMIELGGWTTFPLIVITTWPPGCRV